MAITIGTTSQPVRAPAPALSIRLLLLLYLSIYLSIDHVSAQLSSQ